MKPNLPVKFALAAVVVYGAFGVIAESELRRDANAMVENHRPLVIANDNFPTAATARVYDDGHTLNSGGAYVGNFAEAQTAEQQVYQQQYVGGLFHRGGTFWTNGPVRRIVSAPFRLFRRWRCR